MFLPKNYEHLLFHSSYQIFYNFRSVAGEGNDLLKDYPELKAQRQQEHVEQMRILEEAWNRFIRYFNTCCNEFCRQDPSFAPFLEKVIRFENWKFPKERYTSNVRSIQEYKVAGILAKAEKYPALFLNTFYALYKNIPKGGKGIFLQEVSDEVGQEMMKELYTLVREPLHYELLLWNFQNLLNPRIPRDKSERPLFPEDYKAVLKDTPLYDLVQTRYPFDISLEARIAHTDICAGSGHGKTQIVQSFIADILPRYGFLVMDSQGALIEKILELKPLLQRDVIYINPEDREYIPGITFFGVNLEAIHDNEKVYNTLISFYENIFNDLMGTGLSGKQSGMFGYLAQFLLTIPQATIFTFIDVLVNGEKYRARMQKLPETQRYFFDNLFFNKSYGHTKEEISRKLLELVKTPTIDRILNNTEQKIDFYKAMQEGAIILINTSKDYLGELLSAFFGKFLLGMLYTNVMKRDPNGRDPPFFFFIDEAQEYFLKSMGNMFSQFRKFNVGLTIAHQNLKQLKDKGIDADVRASTAVKIVGTPNKEDKAVWASEMRTDTDFLDSCKKYKEHKYSEWACFIQHEMDKAVKIRAPWFALDKFPKMTAEEHKMLLERNRRKYCVSVLRGKPDGDTTRSTPKDPPDPPRPPARGRSAKPQAKGGDVPKNDKPQGPLPYDDDYF